MKQKIALKEQLGKQTKKNNIGSTDEHKTNITAAISSSVRS
jgi:hypothetical protein